MIKSGITTNTPANIFFGAGVFFKGVDYDEKVAPTETAIKAAIIGATQEGGKCTITPELFAPSLDGALVSIKELQEKVGETANMEVSWAELLAENVKNAVIGTLGTSTDSEYDVITSADAVEAGHFYSGFGFYGHLKDGRPVIVMFKNALCTSGFTTETKNKGNAVFAGTFECMSDIEYGTTKLPYAIFIRKKDGWTAASAAEVAA